ncbi:MAG: hypothetical protein DA408_14625 [Bacteroidetes bacterium]|nr:MAG: hypothetical protein C7N36_11250 [Bacteroidota bacterium]PTM11026.1 MAG: hypothetical protein DA408_14625 [Bacteroidota bacterium]
MDFEWLRIRHFLKDRFQRDTLPDLNAILFVIGIQELGTWKPTFTKEEKQDLLHIATCRLMSYYDYYDFVGRDADGWPHWELVKKIPTSDLREQELLFKSAIIRYFREWEAETANLPSHKP